MKISVSKFVSMSSLLVRILSGPVHSDQVCLITMEDANSIKYAVHASDGRVYDAIALKHWLSVSNSTCVIPTSNIEYVTLTPFLYVLYDRLVRQSREFCTFLKNIQTHTFQTTEKTADAGTQTSSSMFLDVVAYHTRVVGEKTRPRKCLKRSLTSAIETPRKRQCTRY